MKPINKIMIWMFCVAFLINSYRTFDVFNMDVQNKSLALMNELYKLKLVDNGNIESINTMSVEKYQLIAMNIVSNRDELKSYEKFLKDNDWKFKEIEKYDSRYVYLKKPYVLEVKFLEKKVYVNITYAMKMLNEE